MKSPMKPELSKAIAKLCRIDPSSTQIPTSGVSFVLDGGSLLHRILWLVVIIFIVNWLINHVIIKYYV